MNKVILPLLVIGVILGIVATLVISNRNKTTSSTTTSQSAQQQTERSVPSATGKVNQTGVSTLAIPLLSVGGSNQLGRVELADKNGNIEVTIEITEGAKDKQSAAIRLGNCPTPGEVAFNLKDVVSGKSVSTIEKSMADLVPELPMTVVIADSASATAYTSCGDLALPSKSK